MDPARCPQPLTSEWLAAHGVKPLSSEDNVLKYLVHYSEQPRRRSLGNETLVTRIMANSVVKAVDALRRKEILLNIPRLMSDGWKIQNPNFGLRGVLRNKDITDVLIGLDRRQKEARRKRCDDTKKGAALHCSLP